ncbi:hypothetical protein [Thiomonas sp.]|jgi:hypothetical protein|uniref:hypothetical protein n=1 Tax=Thiomonas sp. TaxID=2047785 RepID=UPI00176A055A|nr:hypothetical protein [Thiomonas sp.]
METNTTLLLTAEQSIRRARALLRLVRRQYEPDAPRDAETAQPVLLLAADAIEHAIRTMPCDEAMGGMAAYQLRGLTALLEGFAWQILERGPGDKPSATEREDFTTGLDVAIELADAVLAALHRVQAEGAPLVQ